MKMVKILQRISLIVLAVALTTGCSSQKAWVYHPNSYPPAAMDTGKKIVVLPFDDARPNENHNLYGLYLIPLMPFGWQTLNAPEGIQIHTTSGMWLNYKPTEDFPKALAEDLRGTGLFSDAFFDYRRENSDYAVEGKILSTKYIGRLITYGLSVYGPDLWLIGFPAAWTENDLSLDLRLVDSKTGKALFSQTYTADPRKTLSWIYAIRDDFNYAEMLGEVNKQFCQGISPVVVEAAKQEQAQAEAIKQQQAREEAARQQQAREEAIKQQQAQEQAAKQVQAEAAKAQAEAAKQQQAQPAEAATQQPTNATGPQESK